MLSFPKRYFWYMSWMAILLSCHKPGPTPDQSGTGVAAWSKDSLNYNQGKFFPTISFERFGSENGLPSSHISSLVQDSQGFLWIATDNGLCRYDGKNFKTWQNDQEDSKSLPSNQIIDFAIDSRDRIWLLLAGKGICRFDPDIERFQLFRDSLNKLDKIEVRAKIQLDPKNRIWFSHGYFDTEKETFVSVKGITDNSLNPIAFDAEGNIFCVTPYQKLWKYNENNQAFELYDTLPYFEDQGFYRVRIDRNGNFWAGTAGGHLYKFRPKVDTILADYFGDRANPTKYTLGGTVSDFILSEKTGLIWLAQWGGLTRFEMVPGANPQIYRYFYNEDSESSFPDRIATCVLEDFSGVIWVGTNSGGLAKFAPAKQVFQVFRKAPNDANTLTNNNITAIFQDSKQRLWVGTQKYLNEIDLKTGATRSYPTSNTLGCNNSWITSICEDTLSGRLLITYWGAGFNWFDPKTSKFILPKIKSPEKIVQEKCWMFLQKAILYAPDTVLLIEWGKALSLYYPKTGVIGSVYEMRARGNTFKPELAFCAMMDKSRKLWVGLDQEKGLFNTRLGGTDSTLGVEINHDSTYFILKCENQWFLPSEFDKTSLASGTVTALYEDQKGRIWVGTTNGLHRLEDREKGKFKRYGTKEGFPDVSIAGILEDEQGMFWVSTNGGISQFDPEQGIVKQTFNFNDGLPANQFNGMSCFKGSSGTLFFGSIKGLISFQPKELGINKVPPLISITKIIADGKPLFYSPVNNKVEIPSSTENVQIEFAALDFTRPEMNGYQYQMKGMERNVSTIMQSPRAVYSNMPPGSYHFHVTACNNDGVWNKTGISLQVDVKPKWYQSIGFKILGIIALGLGLYVFIKWREKKIILEQQRGLQIRALQVQVHQAQMNPHFIFNVLTAIKHLIADKRQEEAAAYMDEFATLIRRYLDASVKGDISQMSAVQNELPLSQEIELIDMYVKFEQLKYQNKFEYIREISDGLVPENISLPPMLIQPFVENAIKHGLLHLPPGSKGILRVVFSMDEDGETLRCTIEDNGVGMEESRRLKEASIKHYESHGVRLTNDRVKILNQIGYQIIINGPRDREGGGTMVDISIA